MMEIAKTLFLPSNLINLCFLIGLLLLLKRIKKAAIIMFSVAVGLYAILGMGKVSFWMLRSLEYRYPALNYFPEELKEAKTIVVLAGYAEIVPKLPLSGEVNTASAFRIIEAVRLYRALTDTEILISGSTTTPEIMKSVFVSLGIPAHRVVVENKSTHTYESARNVLRILGSRRFVLVTSAGHMPRAIGAFRNLGMNPIPAPTHYYTREGYFVSGYLPSPLYVHYADLAVHEYLGILWYWLRDRL